MPALSAYDGTTLAYHVSGDGAPLVCLPGGPTDSAYLGDLGGLGAHRQLIRPDLRGTGRSGTPADLASCRCDRLVDDLEALRRHVGLDRMDVLAHCAGANLAVLYAGRYPERVGRLVLVTPSVRAVGLTITGDQRLETARLRGDEPWFPGAFAALKAITEGQATEARWRAVAPFSYGRNMGVVAAFGADGAFDPDAARAALGRLAAPVFLLAGEVDVGAPPPTVAEFAALFPNAESAVQSGAAHHPWLDDAGAFVTAVAAFLDG